MPVNLTRLSRRTVLKSAGAATGAAVAGALSGAILPTSAEAAAPASLTIDSRPIESFNRLSSNNAEGRLVFRGGLNLTSANRDFGGLSGLAMEPDGRRFVTITDAGHWITGELGYAKTAPASIRDARIGPILTQAGRETARKRDQDAEAIALIEGTTQRGTLLIAFERNHRIGRFPLVDRAVGAPTSYLKMPVEARQMRGNLGLEAMTVFKGGPLRGAVVALSERFPKSLLSSAATDTPTEHVGWIWGANGEPQRFTLPDIGGFDLTDVASLADGSLVLLERRFRWYEGVKMRLRLFKPGEIAPGKAAPEGETLLQASMSSEIDNMEGLSVHRDSTGETVLTLVSDDNFNPVLQRTILLQFMLKSA